MDSRTRDYLAGRFGDHYRRRSPTLPPAAAEREWGFIPWTEGPGTTMVRHRSLLDLGDVAGFLGDRAPRHVYFSAARYDDPGAKAMAEKGWRGSDLVFDLDADHLPGVDPDSTPYGEMLAACKDALLRLLDLLEADFGFEDLTVVFSGGRGYHVHVRDPGVDRLGADERREVVDYVRGEVDFDGLVRTEAVAGEAGRETPARKRTIATEGGWSARAHRRIRSTVEELLARDRDSALRRLREYDGIGEKKAERIYDNATDGVDRVREGNIDLSSEFLEFARLLTERELAEGSAPVDDPVTTDLRRLIRLPGSLHGGSGLAVRRIAPDDLDGFDPLDDAVPETFVGQEIAVDVTETPSAAPGTEGTVRLRGDSFTIEEGTQLLPEYVGVFLMARGRASKAPER
jgi:DNA primase small subunit